MSTRFPEELMVDLRGDNPRGLRFVVDVANAYRNDSTLPIDAFQELVDRHTAPGTALPSRGDAAELHAAIDDIVGILAAQEPDAAARRINATLNRYPAHPHLVQLPGRPWSMHLRSDTTNRAQWFASTAAFALGLWLSEKGSCAWGTCEAPGCDDFFIDSGRRAPQRYCTPRCATRARVANHRLKHSAG
ncbi:CGNR zinc finger domain-containing protein [Rhodococcus sp. ACT016]|uniref:CGNR zinc finger domain-containing protein n=1 Tax=Rhodococcus sp. ACT016 TaxID=3134808 RepID=UPI003D2AA75F